jgi:hypothetical protein
MSFRNRTPMHDVVSPILLMSENMGIPLVRKDDFGWLMWSFKSWMPVTFEPTAQVLDEMLSHGEIVINEDQTVSLVPGPWGLGRDGRAGGIA